MSLNVKDPEAYRLAQAIAQATGETMPTSGSGLVRMTHYCHIFKRCPERVVS
jgi:hypothetical protein